MQSFSSDGGMQDFEFIVDAFGDRLITDAHDYFRIAVSRDFPDLDFEPMVGEALGWLITLPPQRAYTHTLVDAACLFVQEELFWKKDALVRYAIVRDGDELEEGE